MFAFLLFYCIYGENNELGVEKKIKHRSQSNQLKLKCRETIAKGPITLSSIFLRVTNWRSYESGLLGP